MEKFLYTLICGGAISRAALEAALTVPQAYILSICADAGKDGVKQKDIQNMLECVYGREKNSMAAKISMAIAPLIEWGFLDSKDDPDDRRGKILALNNGEILQEFETALKKERRKLIGMADTDQDTANKALNAFEESASRLSGFLGWP